MKIWLLFLVLMGAGSTSFAQKKFFRAYKDSAALVQQSNRIVADFSRRVNKERTLMDTLPVAVLNTKPFLIFYSPKANRINLPIWHQLVIGQKDFFKSLARSEEEGKKMFGLFFNGFYLPHELGHALQHATRTVDSNRYQNEYIANEIAVLYWRKLKRTKELKQCYDYAREIVQQLKDPVPAAQDPVKYFNEHYAELGADPYKYGYFQFAQLVKVYEDKALPGFDEYIRDHFARSKKGK